VTVVLISPPASKMDQFCIRFSIYAREVAWRRLVKRYRGFRLGS